MNINFAQSRTIKHGDIDSRTFNLGSAVVHELFHAVTGLEDKVNNTISYSMDWTGPVVDFVNTIRVERGLPIPAAYLTSPTIFGGRSKFAFSNVNAKKPEKIYYATRKRP